MLCKHCGRKISLLKRLTDAEFCSPAHRSAFMQMEQEAAIARLMQSGSNLARPAEVAAPKPKQAAKKKTGRDEIPAPLAGLVAEAYTRPKPKLKPVSRPVVHEWELVRELPQSPLVIQARKLGVADRIPIEAYPARKAPAAVLIPERESVAVAGEVLEAVAMAPLASEAGPLPAPGKMRPKALEPGWQKAGMECEFAQPGPALAGASPGEPALVELAGARPVEAARAAVESEPGPCETKPEARRPKMSAGIQPHLTLTEAEADVAGAAEQRGDGMRGTEPAICGLIALAAGVGAAATGMKGEAGQRLPELQGLQGLQGWTSGPLSPEARMAPAAAAIGDASGLMEMDVAAGLAAKTCRGVQQKALRPKRRLVGPRVKRAASQATGVAEASLAAISPAEPVRAGRIGWMAAPAPIEAVMPEPGLPAAEQHSRASVGLAGVTEAAYGRARAMAHAVQAVVRSEPAWAHAAELFTPASGLRVEDPAICTVEAAGAAVEVEGPPMIDRLLPVFASRGLDLRREVVLISWPWAGTDWKHCLSKSPAMRGSSLTVDHADGSGPRTAAAMPKPHRPWLSIQMPNLHLASWRSAPADLKWIMMALPLILVIALYSFLPERTKNSVETASGAPSEPTVLSQRAEAIRTAIMERAAVKLADDFRSGLGAWQGPGGWAQTWTYTSANYVVPGQLALYDPSLRLRDYVFSFLGQIERRSINWVVRARDERNYLAMRIVMTRSGPMPAASLVRYAVVNGRAGKQTVLPLPMTFRDGTMQQVEVTVAGDTITTRVMGQIVDSFTESELNMGGVGFFSPKGDRALLRWISVTHQYDYIGRLCALLAPHSVMSREAGNAE